MLVCPNSKQLEGNLGKILNPQICRRQFFLQEIQQFFSKYRMEIATSGIQCSKQSISAQSIQQDATQEQKLRNISILVKEWKNSTNNDIQCKVSWMQIRKYGIFLMKYLSQDRIEDKLLFYETLASLDSLLSIFKIKLFQQLNFTKTFYNNIQREFDELCLGYNFVTGEKQQKLNEFHMYSILFLLVMLIYFSGRPQLIKFKAMPLQIINKAFMNSLISLELNITQKNQRIIGLLLAYLVKNVNLRIYGEKMLKFILNHLDKIHMSRTVYHFVYCLRQIHMNREIDIKILRRYSLIQKLWKFWAQTFDHRESIYLVDYINVLLRRYPLLINSLGNMEPLIQKILNFQTINEFSVVHQGIILEIMSKVYPRICENIRHLIIQKAFSTCQMMAYPLKLLTCIIGQQSMRNIFQYIFPFVDSFNQICRYKELKSVLLGLEILGNIIQKCAINNGIGMMDALQEKLGKNLEELKEYQICRVEIARIEDFFKKMVSIKYLTLC